MGVNGVGRGTPVLSVNSPPGPCLVVRLWGQAELFINFLEENRIIKLKCVKQIQMRGFKSPPRHQALNRCHSSWNKYALPGSGTTSLNGDNKIYGRPRGRPDGRSPGPGRASTEQELTGSGGTGRWPRVTSQPWDSTGAETGGRKLCGDEKCHWKWQCRLWDRPRESRLHPFVTAA